MRPVFNKCKKCKKEMKGVYPTSTREGNVSIQSRTVCEKCGGNKTEYNNKNIHPGSPFIKKGE